MRLRRGADGFTLVELLVAIVILGIITVPLSNVVIGYFRNTDATTARLIESHDAQISSAYWAQDVASIGTRSTTHPYLLNQSVSLGSDGWTDPTRFVCGVAGTPIVRLAWDDFTVDPETKVVTTTLVQVAYVLTTPTELHRLRCNGSAAVVSDVSLAHYLDKPPAVTCTTPTDCEATTVPTTLTLTLTLTDPTNSNGTYVVPLTGARRES